MLLPIEECIQHFKPLPQGEQAMVLLGQQALQWALVISSP
jgi:hypothetical protein